MRFMVLHLTHMVYTVHVYACILGIEGLHAM